MRSIPAFVKSHSYEILVTFLVLALGVASRQLRHSRQSAPVSSPAAPTPQATAVPSPSPTASPEPELQWLRPVSGGILTAYSDSEPQWSTDMDCWQIHAAVDLAAAPDEPVRAAAAGTVESVSDDPLLGLTVVLRHESGFRSVYSALASANCAAGQRLNAGDALGTAGNSADSEALLGAHLHFALLQDGLPVKPSFLP